MFFFIRISYCLNPHPSASPASPPYTVHGLVLTFLCPASYSITLTILPLPEPSRPKSPRDRTLLPGSYASHRIASRIACPHAYIDTMLFLSLTYLISLPSIIISYHTSSAAADLRTSILCPVSRVPCPVSRVPSHSTSRIRMRMYGSYISRTLRRFAHRFECYVECVRVVDVLVLDSYAISIDLHVVAGRVSCNVECLVLEAQSSSSLGALPVSVVVQCGSVVGEPTHAESSTYRCAVLNLCMSSFEADHHQSSLDM